MTRINYSDNISIQGRALHLQTNTLDDDRTMISTLFEGGRVLTKQEICLDHTVDEKDIPACVESYHNKRMESIELLYAISAHVKAVRHPLSLVKLGSQFLKWNLLDEAIEKFELAIQYNADGPEAYLHLGEAYLRKGKFEEAIRILKKGTKVASYADLWLKLGIAYLMQKQYKESQASFQMALQMNASYADAYFYLALYLLEKLANSEKFTVDEKKEQLKIIGEHFKQAMQLSERYRDKAITKILHQVHNTDIFQTLDSLWRLSRTIPKCLDMDFHDLFYLNFLYGENGRETETINTYVTTLREFIQKHPKYPDLHHHLGIAYLIQCRDLFSKALQHFHLACKLNPGFKRAKDHLKLVQENGKELLILLRALLK